MFSYLDFLFGIVTVRVNFLINYRFIFAISWLIITLGPQIK